MWSSSRDPINVRADHHADGRRTRETPGLRQPPGRRGPREQRHSEAGADRQIAAARNPAEACSLHCAGFVGVRAMRELLYPLIVLILLFRGTAAADPIAVTSGFVAFTDEPGAFRVAGDGFDVAIGFFPQVVSGTFWHDRCVSGCAAGTTVDFGTTTYTFSQSFQGVGGTVNGIDYPELFRGGELTFTGPTVVLPSVFPEPGSPGPLLLGEFTFRGNVSLFTTESRTGPPVFSSELTGRGTARVFGAPISSDLFQVDDLEYTFAPIPEPSTLTMLVPGVIGVATVLRRRRSRAKAAHAPRVTCRLARLGVRRWQRPQQ